MTEDFDNDARAYLLLKNKSRMEQDQIIGEILRGDKLNAKL